MDTVLIQQAKFVLLDSSILGNLTRDHYSTNADRRSSSRRFLERMSQLGLVPFLSLHQFDELVKHKNEQVAHERVEFLKNLPQVAWIQSSNGDGLGSVVDLLRAECAVILERPDSDAQRVRKSARPHVMQFGSGSEALSALSDFWPIIREQFLWTLESRSREIVALSRSKVIDISKEKLGSFLSGRFRDKASVKAIFHSLRPKLTQAIQSRGDRRIKNAETIADEFYSDIENDFDEKYCDPEFSPANLLEEFGVSADEFTPDTEMGDVLDLAHFRSDLKTAHKSLNVPWERLRQTVSISQCPSWCIRNLLSKHGQQRGEHKGSELNDHAMASFSPYCDLVYVDSQVKEDLRRVLQKSPGLSSLVNRVEKVSTTDRILKTLERGGF